MSKLCSISTIYCYGDATLASPGHIPAAFHTSAELPCNLLHQQYLSGYFYFFYHNIPTPANYSWVCLGGLNPQNCAWSGTLLNFSMECFEILTAGEKIITISTRFIKTIQYFGLVRSLSPHPSCWLLVVVVMMNEGPGSGVVTSCIPQLRGRYSHHSYRHTNLHQGGYISNTHTHSLAS